MSVCACANPAEALILMMRSFTNTWVHTISKSRTQTPPISVALDVLHHRTSMWTVMINLEPSFGTYLRIYMGTYLLL